jgi:hypothetical protein
MFSAVLDAFKAAFLYVLDFLVGFVNPLISGLFDNFPALQKGLGAAVEFVAVANYWIPLDYGLVLVSALFTIQGIFIGIKLAIKIFVPTLG